jgi:hypothetical protein
MTRGRRKRAGRTCEVVNARAWFTLVRARRATVIATLRNAIGAAIDVEKEAHVMRLKRGPSGRSPWDGSFYPPASTSLAIPCKASHTTKRRRGVVGWEGAKTGSGQAQRIYAIQTTVIS